MSPSIADLPWPVRTERLTVRPATPADAPGVFHYRSREAVTEWTTSRPTDLASYALKYEDPAWLRKLLVLEQDGVIVGDLYLTIEDAWSQAEVVEQAASTQAEIGWCLDPAFGGRGLATEAVTALLEVCFEGLGVRRVVALCFADNTASWRLMERVGMRRETHTVQDSLHRSGRWLDGLGYAMLADEWRLTRGPDR